MPIEAMDERSSRAQSLKLVLEPKLIRKIIIHIMCLPNYTKRFSHSVYTAVALQVGNYLLDGNRGALRTRHMLI